jgi:uncharacterized protein (TIGR01777 family)
VRVLLTGGTGFVGGALCRALTAQGADVTVLTRAPETRGARLPDTVRLIRSTLDISDDECFDAFVNLAGEGIAERRWTHRRKNVLLESRLTTTRALVTLARRLQTPPSVMVSASAIGFYGDAGGAELTEASSAVRKDFGYRLCDAWEEEARRVQEAGVRLAILRIGVVLAADGGMMKQLLPLYRLGAGARLGGGGQWFSWIHRDDLLEIILRCLESPSVEGVFNAVAPNPVPQAEFHATLCRLCHRPDIWRIPAPVLRWTLGEMSALMLASQRVVPGRLLHQGFAFRFPDVESALSDIVSD